MVETNFLNWYLTANEFIAVKDVRKEPVSFCKFCDIRIDTWSVVGKISNKTEEKCRANLWSYLIKYGFIILLKQNLLSECQSLGGKKYFKGTLMRISKSPDIFVFI